MAIFIRYPFAGRGRRQTYSLGVTFYGNNGAERDQQVNATDGAMYAARRLGAIRYAPHCKNGHRCVDKQAMIRLHPCVGVEVVSQVSALRPFALLFAPLPMPTPP